MTMFILGLLMGFNFRKALLDVIDIYHSVKRATEKEEKQKEIEKNMNNKAFGFCCIRKGAE